MARNKRANHKKTNIMVKNAVFLITLGLLVPMGTALAHGITVETSIEGGVVVVSSSYSSTQPLVDASVSVYSPSDPDNAWQTGRTDRTGRFAFVPDVEGEWTVAVDDRQGHMKRTAVAFRPDVPEEKKLSEETLAESAEPVENRLNTIHKIILGLSLIIGITGFFYGLKARQEQKKITGN